MGHMRPPLTSNRGKETQTSDIAGGQLVEPCKPNPKPNPMAANARRMKMKQVCPVRITRFLRQSSQSVHDMVLERRRPGLSGTHW